MRPRSSATSQHSHAASNGGLIVTASALSNVHRELIVALAARHKLPAVYPSRLYVTAGGLISYAARSSSISIGGAAGYVDRIIKGANPATCRCEQPTKFELVVNRKTAKALGLDLPPPLLARADEVME